MKKVLSLLLVLVLALGMSTVAFAFSVADAKNTYDGFYGELDLGEIDPGTTEWWHPVSTAGNNSFSVTAKGTAEILAEKYYISSNGVYSERMLSDVKLRTRVAEGADTFKVPVLDSKNTDKIPAHDSAAGVELVFATAADMDDVTSAIGTVAKDSAGVPTKLTLKNVAGVKIEFVDPFKSTNEDGKDFDFYVYPVVDGTTWDWEDQGLHVTGTLVNPVVEVNGDTNYVDAYSGVIIKAEANVRSLEYDLGPQEDESTVIVVGRAVNGQKYWGVANTDASEAQDAIMAQYDIDLIYNLDVIGLDRVHDHVELDVDPKAYVYDGDLNFLGMGNANLPFKTTYYVSYHEIEVEVEVEPEGELPPEEELEFPEAPAATGGWDAGAGAGLFENPSTGA